MNKQITALLLALSASNANAMLTSCARHLCSQRLPIQHAYFCTEIKNETKEAKRRRVLGEAVKLYNICLSYESQRITSHSCSLTCKFLAAMALYGGSAELLFLQSTCDAATVGMVGIGALAAIGFTLSTHDTWTELQTILADRKSLENRIAVDGEELCLLEQHSHDHVKEFAGSSRE